MYIYEYNHTLLVYEIKSVKVYMSIMYDVCPIRFLSNKVENPSPKSQCNKRVKSGSTLSPRRSPKYCIGQRTKDLLFLKHRMTGLSACYFLGGRCDVRGESLELGYC